MPREHVAQTARVQQRVVECRVVHAGDAEDGVDPRRFERGHQHLSAA